MNVLPTHRGTILIVSYYFPPDAAVGGLRAARFVRALPEFGWEPLVLTVRDELREQGLDAQRLTGLDGVKVVRIGELPRLWRRARVFAARWRLQGRTATRHDGRSGAASVGDGAPESPWQRLKRWVVSLGVLLPDDKKHWAIPAAIVATWLVRRHRAEWVMTSGPPFSSHFAGAAARLLTGTRWIADFRDPWIDLLPERDPRLRSRLSDFIERRMEAVVVRLADLVAVTTPRMQEAFRTRYPAVRAERFCCLTNMIDPQACATPARRADQQTGSPEPLIITYAGSLYFDRTPEPLFRALSELIHRRRIRSEAVRVVLAGDCHAANGVLTETLIEQYGLQGVVALVGRLTYPQALRLMERSHLLLVLAPLRHRLVVPAKVYDYLGVRKRLLAIAEPGATADLIRATGSGECFSSTDVQGLAEFLEAVIAAGHFEYLRNEASAFEAYSARHVTANLAAQLFLHSRVRRVEVVAEA